MTVLFTAVSHGVIKLNYECVTPGVCAADQWDMTNTGSTASKLHTLATNAALMNIKKSIGKLRKIVFRIEKKI